MSGENITRKHKRNSGGGHETERKQMNWEGREKETENEKKEEHKKELVEKGEEPKLRSGRGWAKTNRDKQSPTCSCDREEKRDMTKTDERHTELKTTPNMVCQIHRKVLNYKIWRVCFSYSSGRSGCVINRVISPSQLEQIKFVSQSQDRSLSQIRSGIQYWKAVGINVSRSSTKRHALPVTRWWVRKSSKMVITTISL